MSDELGLNSASRRPHERVNERSDSLRAGSRPEAADPAASNLEQADAEDSSLENYVIPGYVVEDEPTAAHTERFYAPRPSLGRGFDANADRASVPSPYPSPASYSPNAGISQPPIAGRKSKWAWLLPGRKARPQNAVSAPPNPSAQPYPQRGTDLNRPYVPAVGMPAVGAPAAETTPSLGIDPVTGLEIVGVPLVVAAPRLWEKQPYRAIAQISAIAGTLTAAWLLGILTAQLVPGNLKRPPLQESVLRKSSRLASGLWHLPQLWQTPPAETRIEAIPLPETGPISKPIELSPVERQPLIDELNAVETELLTLDRRIQTLEKRLGKPPYQDAGVENRINALRGAIDPPVRTEAIPEYEPTPRDRQAALLAVAAHKITLPSDALFAPGDSTLKDSELLNQVLDQLVNYPESTVVIRSYSDDQVDAIATRKYTLAQAAQLSEYLGRSLPAGYRWVTIGGGSSQPIEPNDSDINRQRNRRIEILVDTR